MDQNKMKPSCNKVKNPCKICLQHVGNRNGLQCQGACKKWAHFKCLNYTPGKIADIKAGIIKVTCPCPDCETTQVKEYLVNPPYTCSNQQCPANKSAACISHDCPSKKKERPLPPCPAPEESLTPCLRPGTCPSGPPTPPCAPPACAHPPPPCAEPPRCKVQNTSPPPRKKKPICHPEPYPNTYEKPKRRKKRISPASSLLSSEPSSACRLRCASSSSSCSSIGSPKIQASMVQALQEMCSTVGKLSTQLKELMCKILQ